LFPVPLFPLSNPSEFQTMKKSFLITAALLATALVAQADELFVSIHSGAAMAQGAGLVLAGQALEQKVDVRVLLCDAAGDIAVNGQSMPTLKPRNVTPQQMLQGLINAGAKVEVCALYLPNTGRQATDLLAGVTPAKPADIAAHLLKPGVRTLAF
jgi:sulfur relay (sulfurtransferase) complex TusBCD TusD component (DsrE family)